MSVVRRYLPAGGILLGLILPSTALAALPSVTGLEVSPVDEGVELTWDEIDDPSITHYRIYYSMQSIIDNDGQWDDFEETDGPKGSHIVKNLRPGQKIFAAVTAMNSAGEQSEWFEQEVEFTFIGGDPMEDDEEDFPSITIEPVSITGDGEIGAAVSNVIMLNEGVTSTPSQNEESLQIIADEATNSDDEDESLTGTLKLLGARSIAPSRVSLTFSHFISISDSDAPSAFRIIDSEGQPLQIKTLTIDRADVILETAEQQAEKVYQVIVSEPLRGIPDLPLDQISRRVLFRGHTEGLEASVTSSNNVETNDLFPSDVHDVVMTAEQASDGTYHVETTWKMQSTPSGFVVRQTRDGGKVFSPASRLPASFNGVTLDGVMAGTFGIFIQTFGSEGYVSPGVLISADLPANNRGKPPIVVRQVMSGAIIAPPVTNIPVVPVDEPDYIAQPPVSSDLTDSGAGVLLSLGAAGAYAGWRRMKHRKQF